MKVKATDKRIARAEGVLMFNAINVKGGATTRQSVPAKVIKGKAEAKVTKGKDGAEKVIGTRVVKEIGVKAKEIGAEEEKDLAEKDGVKEMEQKEEENLERLKARAKVKEKGRRA